jgi:hypothetical protein
VASPRPPPHLPSATKGKRKGAAADAPALSKAEKLKLKAAEKKKAAAATKNKKKPGKKAKRVVSTFV